MFTGLIQEVGVIQEKAARPHGVELLIAASFASDLQDGESVAVNGVCLTVSSLKAGRFGVYASEETLDKSGIGRLSAGDRVNLERALRLSDRLGGHWVQGHVDGVVQMAGRETRGPGQVVTFSGPRELLRYLVPKGSVCLDGVSLTVNTVSEDRFTVYLIPHTLTKTTLPLRSTGDRLNVEVDILAKYVEHFLHHNTENAPGQKQSLAQLLANGGFSG